MAGMEAGHTMGKRMAGLLEDAASREWGREKRGARRVKPGVHGGSGKRETSPEGRPERGHRARKGDSRGGVRALLAALLIASLAALAWVYLFTDVLNVRRVEIYGNQRLSGDYLRSISGITSRTHLLKMDVGAVEKALLAEPYVLRVEVHRRFPHTVMIRVTERTPVGCLVQNGRFHLVDREGLVVESADADREEVPEITGLRMPLLYPGARLEDPRFQGIVGLLEEIPEELRERTEEVGYAEGEGYFLLADNTRVIFGDCSDLRRKGEIAQAAMREIAPRYPGLQYVDVTYPDHPAIKPR
ncbi:cell division protein FtsQ/DivIB [Candidatus Solincola sp.]|nr:FtsQ-type POTRA domain-containing protein [Actinomycetota bacterium]